VWALVVAAAGTALWSLERQRRKSEGDLRKLNEQLLSQAEELKDHRERLTELIDARTAELSGANARLSVEASEREMAEAALKASETQLRMLSARLMSAQETERRNIARELHDELGHSLTIMKLRLKSVERKLQAHADIRDNCDDIIKFIDQTIESVRRLSRDLSPAILEDLGLTAAIHWLMDNFSRNFDGDMELDIEDIDHLFTENSQIMIYRVLQEAVTNIGKHAQAGKVSVVIKKTDARVSFVIQDNGKGFGSPLSLMRDPAGKGLGLAIMEERVRMLNGSLDVQSQEGIGTRIAFSIPLQEVKP
jgi:signal transduction histidine kinase